MKAKNLDPRFNFYFDWTEFSIGITIGKPHSITGWNFVIAINIMFFSSWVYLNKRK